MFLTNILDRSINNTIYEFKVLFYLL